MRRPCAHLLRRKPSRTSPSSDAISSISCSWCRARIRAPTTPSPAARGPTIDGMDNNERYIGTIGVKPSLDAIQEIRVQTNLYSAEVGRTGGGVINILTKSGTNQYHGSGYEFYRNGRFDSRDYFATVDPI